MSSQHVSPSTGHPAERLSTLRRMAGRWIPWLIAAALLFLSLFGTTSGIAGTPMPWFQQFLDITSTFSKIFLAIFIEGLPFLLLGALASGILSVYVSQADLSRWLPKKPLGGALVGSLLGLVFPVGLPGGVLLSRRLMRMGAPAPVGVALLLSAPVLNPVVLAAVFTGFGTGPIFGFRLILGTCIAIITGLIFSQAPGSGLLGAETLSSSRNMADKGGMARAWVIAADECFDYGRFFVLGGLLAALLQVIIRQPGLLSLAQGPFSTALVMAGLGGLLSPGATSAPFSALALPGLGPAGIPPSGNALLVFLVCAPLVDIKAFLMYLRIFRLRTAVYLLLVPLLLALVALVCLSTFWPGWGG